MSDEECLHGIPETWCGICTPRGDEVATSRVGQYGFHGGVTKQDVLWEICQVLSLPKASVGIGSSLPSDVFDAAALQCGVPAGSMPEVGESIARRAGLSWPADADSRGSVSGGGSTVTLEGLKIMRDALRLLLG